MIEGTTAIAIEDIEAGRLAIQEAIETERETERGGEDGTSLSERAEEEVGEIMASGTVLVGGITEEETENEVCSLKLLPKLSLFWSRSDGVLQDGGRDRDARERERPRERSRDRTKRDTRSRSPRRDRERDRDGRRDDEVEKEYPHRPVDNGYQKTRSETPPVSFKVSSSVSGQDHERMELDGDAEDAKGTKGKKGKKAAKKMVEEDDDDDDDLVVEDDGMAAMKAMMGFGGFGTTHEQKVAGNDVYAVRKEKKREYRQYMNRVGGFNRPLSPPREA